MESLSNFIFSIPGALFSPSQQQQQQQQSSTANDSVNSEINPDNNIESTPIMDDTNQPITGVCLVSKAGAVPTGYICIRKVYDDPSRDADLMADSIIERKDRFLCITRAVVLANNRALVVEDIKIVNERDPPPPNYIPLTFTVDSREKGTAKRLICVKLIDRQAGMRCICDIIFLYRTKRAPQFYTIIGEINGFQVCVKEGTVPSTPIPTGNIYPDVSSRGRSSSITDHQSHLNTGGKKSDDKEILEGIPFEINPKYLVTARSNMNIDGLDSIPSFSAHDIEAFFHYDFKREQAALQP